MKKYERLKKRAIIEGAVAATLVLAVLGSMFLFSDLEGTRKTELKKIKRQIQTDQAQLDEYNQQIDRAGVSSQIYDKAAHTKRDMNFYINRGSMRFELEDLKEKYRLSHLSMEVSPFEPFSNNELKALDISAIHSRVDIKVGAMSDMHIFSFIEELNYRMPGLLRAESLHLTREKNMNIETLQQMKMGIAPQLVSGIMKFIWYGFAPLDEQKKKVDG